VKTNEERLRKALEWQVNLHHGISKSSGRPVTDQECDDALAEAMDALSAAPKVAWRGKSQLARVPGGERVLVPEDSQEGPLEGLDFERMYETILLECPPKGEQPEESEQEEATDD